MQIVALARESRWASLITNQGEVAFEFDGVFYRIRQLGPARETGGTP